jgi:hypothetical protein
LAGPALRAAKLNEESLNLANDERNFLAQSERAEKDRASFDRIQRAIWSLRFVVVIETALIVVLLIILIARSRIDRDQAVFKEAAGSPSTT